MKGKKKKKKKRIEKLEHFDYTLTRPKVRPEINQVSSPDPYSLHFPIFPTCRLMGIFYYFPSVLVRDSGVHCFDCK